MSIKKEETKKLYGAWLGGYAYMGMIFLYILISFIGGSLLSLFATEGTTVYYVISSLFSVLSMAIIILLFNLKRGEKIQTTINLEKFNPLFILVALLMALGMFFGFGFINTLIAKLVIKMGGSVSSVELPLDNVRDYILLVIFLAIFPAFFEEAFFRGLLCKNLEGGKIIGIVISVAMAFALYHGSVNQFFYQFIYGGCLAFLAIKSGSILPTFIAHLLNNFVILTCEFFNIEINLFNPYLIITGIVCLLISFYLMLKLNSKKEIEETKKVGYRIKDFWLPYGLVGGAFCLLIIIVGVLGG